MGRIARVPRTLYTCSTRKGRTARGGEGLCAAYIRLEGVSLSTIKCARAGGTPTTGNVPNPLAPRRHKNVAGPPLSVLAHGCQTRVKNNFRSRASSRVAAPFVPSRDPVDAIRHVRLGHPRVPRCHPRPRAPLPSSTPTLRPVCSLLITSALCPLSAAKHRRASFKIQMSWRLATVAPPLPPRARSPRHRPLQLLSEMAHRQLSVVVVAAVGQLGGHHRRPWALPLRSDHTRWPAV